MSTEEKTDSGKNSESKDETSRINLRAKLALFLKKNLTSVILSVTLILISIWFTAKINSNSNHFENEKIQLITRLET